MYEELIKALHGWNVYGQHLERCNCELAAANAIESLTDQLAALQAENGSKDREIKHWKEEAEQWKTLRRDADRIREVLMGKELSLISKNIKLEAALSRVTAERDAAVRTLDLICEHCGFITGSKECADCGCPIQQWRGAQGEA